MQRSWSRFVMAFVLIVAVLALGLPAYAESDGIIGYSGIKGATCADCHTGAPLTLAMWYSGPTNLKPGQKATYQLTGGFFSMNPPLTSGMNIAATGGTLAINAAMAGKIKLVNGELTHVKNAGVISTWTFNWTAPATDGVYTIHGALLYGDNNGTNTGDVTGALPLTIRVGTCNATPDCDDGNECTTDSCNTTTHACINKEIDGCCNTDGECEDGNPCTKNKCVLHKCNKYMTTPCCTTDSACADTNPCTKDACDQATHLCTHDAIPGCCQSSGPPCDDGNACTTDTCAATSAQCVYTPLPNCCSDDGDCTDNDACTTDTCGTAGVCSNVLRADCCRGPAECDDADVCTTDECEANGDCTHTSILGCCNSAADCDDGYACTTETCTENVCVFTAVPGCTPPDAGPGDDAMPSDDATTGDDATPPDDATPADDAEVLPDATTDAAQKPGDGGTTTKSSGGGCRVSADDRAPIVGLALVVGIALLLGAARRRRR